MEYIKLKNSNLMVSRICMGGCPMGQYGWGDVQEKDLLEAVAKAVDVGVNFFDTADAYGLGKSEITLGKGLGAHRKDVVIQSKFGVKAGNGKTTYDNSPEYIELALEQSLERLKTDYIDIYIVHYRDYNTPIEVVVDKLRDLKKQGKIRYYGLSNIHEDKMDELIPYKGEFVSCQNEYSLACRKYENELLQLSSLLDLTPLTWGSLGQGILTGKYTKDNINFGSNDRRSRDIYVNFHGEKLEQNLKIVEVLKEISLNHNKPVSACAIRFILDHLAESVALVGIKNPKQLLTNLEAMDWHLTKEELMKLDEISK